jgi:hypothetical protein
MTARYRPPHFLRNVPSGLVQPWLSIRDVQPKSDSGVRTETQTEPGSQGSLKPKEDVGKGFNAALAQRQNRFFLAGDHWSVTYAGQSKVLKHSKGLRYIEHLLRNQGKAVHVSELFYAINPPQGGSGEIQLGASGEWLNETGLSISDLGDAGEAMDPAGNARMRRHLEDLVERIDKARNLGDEDKQAQLEDEHDQILGYLAPAYGLGGRPRKASSMVERLRKNVTKRIHVDIDRIKTIFPELGHHLACIKTGTFCQYAPHPEVEWRFDSP